MTEQPLATLAGGLPGRPLDHDHLLDDGDREAKALTRLQARSADDLYVRQLLTPAADAVHGDGAQSRVTSELADPEFAGWCDGALSDPRVDDEAGRYDEPAAAPANLATVPPPVGVVVQCEISAGVPAIAGPAGGTALVLVRIFGEPIGALSLEVPAQGLSAGRLAAAIVEETGPLLRERLRECGLPFTGALPTDGLTPPRTPGFVSGREAALVNGPEITVAVCTRDRTDDLAQLLESLRHQEYDRLKVLVIDNAPSDGSTRRLVEALDGELELDYIVEPNPGLSWARNRAIEASDSEIIAWADDDEVADPWWAAEIARAFYEVPEAGAVTGLVAPAELATQCQAWFEAYSGVRRGRGFEREILSPATAAVQSPLYPLPPYGAGANMAFRRDAIVGIGGFDVALGTGTATLAGEDTAAFSSLLLTGGTVVYQPSAIMHHRHRRDNAALERVMLGYGRGLSAYYASMVARHPRCLPELVRLSRRALRDQLSRHGRKRAELQGFPADLLGINRKGLLQGAFLYPGARLHARRLAAASGQGSAR